MDSADEQLLFYFGTPLDPLEEDDVPKKKIAIEDQIVTDENGRRRFHGAFTGGFSAGFWNTVGSLEGWKPTSFKSSRTEKAEIQRFQQPKDFMDDEDLGEFGIAPQRIQAKEDFTKIASNNQKRTANFTNRPTDPLAPILQNMLEPPKAKVALRLLMQMGWKPGQGIGARQTRKEKVLAKKRNNRELYVIKKYGCDVEPCENSASINSSKSTESSEDEDDFEITFAPDDIDPIICNSKDNVFGLGYSGLGGTINTKVSSHINLFGPLEVLGKDSKKLSIRGQAFGVGALEEEDEDIYAKDDMSQYDFCMSDKTKNVKKKNNTIQEQGTLEGFTAISQTNKSKTVFVITPNANFQPKNWLQRKTRFSKPTDIEMTNIIKNNALKKRGIGRHDIGPDDRGKMLSGKTFKSVYEEITTNMVKKNTSEATESQCLPKTIKENATYFASKSNIPNQRSNEYNKIDAAPVFKPFAPNIEKQDRYEKFLAADLKNEEDAKKFLDTIQPIHLSEWDREMERKEFMQAQNIFKPLNGLMSERFVSKAFLNDSSLLPSKIKEEVSEKKAINVQRTKIMWKPCSLICKRFNTPEPFSGDIQETKPEKKGKFSIFDYIENSINSKKNFITPVIIPKHVEKPRDVQTNNSASLKAPSIENISNSDVKISAPASAVQSVTRKTKDPKSELEIKIEELKDKHPSEKKDLFKCVFDSSSESDSEPNDCEKSEIEVETRICSEILDKLTKPTLASKNILQNNSPPRGIFASLLSDATRKVDAKSVSNKETQNVEKIVFKPSNERKCTSEITLENTYGPKLPEKIPAVDSKTAKEQLYNNKVMELLSSKPSELKYIEKWVEKQHTSKHKKKHKKDSMKKSKHKKKKKKK